MVTGNATVIHPRALAIRDGEDQTVPPKRARTTATNKAGATMASANARKGLKVTIVV